MCRVETSLYLGLRRPPAAIESAFIENLYPRSREFSNVDAA